MHLDPTSSTTELAALKAARRDFPRYQIDMELTLDRPAMSPAALIPAPARTPSSRAI
jgi:hypothetical protein